MDFVIIGNQWDVHKDNPTSKHHVAMELVRKGHRVLWVNGTGMRTPSIGSGADRGRIWTKISDACKGVYRQEARGKSEEDVQNIQHPMSNDQCLPSHLHGPNTSDGRAQQQSTNNKQLTTGALWVIAPLILPLPGLGMIRKLNEGIYLWVINRAVRELGFDEPMLINFLPIIPGVLKKWKLKSVYYCVDRWSAFTEYDAELMEKLDIECCENSDCVFASARDLEERCRKHNANTHLVLHGVDYEHFGIDTGKRQEERGKGEEAGRKSFNRRWTPMDADGWDKGKADRPGDLLEGRIIGTFGVIDERIDQELLVKLSRQLNGKDEGGDLRPEVGSKAITTNNLPALPNDREPCQRQARQAGQQLSTNIVLIGKSDVDVSRLEAEPNILLLGPKNFEELPAYISHFDVGVIVYVLNDQTRAINPIKLREMLAGGCRVVSTALPEVSALQAQEARGKRQEIRGKREVRGVFVAGSHDEFVEMVKDLLEKPLSADEKVRISRSMENETWSAKVDEILEIVGTADERR